MACEREAVDILQGMVSHRGLQRAEEGKAEDGKKFIRDNSRKQNLFGPLLGSL
jgi:hypothetical protein